MPRDRNSKRFLFITGSGGGGHLANARSLVAAVRRRKECADWEVHIEDVSALFQGMTLDPVYNWILAIGIVWILPLFYKFIRFTYYLGYLPARWGTKKYLKTQDYDAIVSFVPWMNEHLACSMRNGAPLITIMTDFEHSAEHEWIQTPLQHLIVGTSRGREQAQALHHPPERIHAASGMIVNPSFYGSITAADKQAELTRLGLDPAKRTVLLFFGGIPPTGDTMHYHNAIMQHKEQFNILVLCGGNSTLADKMHSMADRDADVAACTHIVGFTDEVARYMKVSDVLIGKPGPGVVSEAIVARLPMILDCRPGKVMPQEECVVTWTQESGVALILSGDDDLTKYLQAPRLQQCLDNIKLIENNGVEDCVSIIADVVLQDQKNEGLHLPWYNRLLSYIGL